MMVTGGLIVIVVFRGTRHAAARLFACLVLMPALRLR
jgi:hypothetical protein